METICRKSPELEISEFELRQLAGLCQHCGMAVTFGGSSLCEQCYKVRDIVLMKQDWANWGIAA